MTDDDADRSQPVDRRAQVEQRLAGVAPIDRGGAFRRPDELADVLTALDEAPRER